MKQVTARVVAILGLVAITACQQPAPTSGSRPSKSPPTASTDIAAKYDPMRAVQTEAVEEGRSPYFHWGPDPADYDGYDSHSNRLIPVYVLGGHDGGDVDLGKYSGEQSVYRDAAALRRLYGELPTNTLNPDAEYLDQTDIHRLQMDALTAGRKHVFLFIFDGLDWPLTQLAGIVRDGRVPDPSNDPAFFKLPDDVPFQTGHMVTSPWGEALNRDPDAQTIGGAKPGGGYDPKRGGARPWESGDPRYLMGRPGHDVADSASSAVAMTTGEKTVNGAINVTPEGEQLQTVAHAAQHRGMAVGSVTSVPFNHATATSAYAHNVHRGDYQDLARDMLGLPSVSHPDTPLTGMDVVLGAGYGLTRPFDGQGANFLPGNRFIAEPDLERINADNGGRYRVVQRQSDVIGGEALREAARDARENGLRLFGLFGTRYGHLPYATADGDYAPAPDAGGRAETYSKADRLENPALWQMTEAALTVLSADNDGFWLVVEQGDVDWAAHGNNVDNAVGAVFDGVLAVNRIIEWVETHSSWEESLLIVTADHGHLLVWDDPEALAERIRTPVEKPMEK